MRNLRSLLYLVIPICLLLLAGTSVRAEKRSRVGSLTFAVPDKWTCKINKNGQGALLTSPTPHKLGKSTSKDMLLARGMPTQGHTLEEFKAYLESKVKAQADKLSEELKRHGGTAHNIQLAKSFKITTTQITVGKVAAYELSYETVQIIDGQPLKTRGRTIIAVAGNISYLVSASYELDREKIMKPVGDAFLASLRFE